MTRSWSLMVHDRILFFCCWKNVVLSSAVAYFFRNWNARETLWESAGGNWPKLTTTFVIDNYDVCSELMDGAAGSRFSCLTAAFSHMPFRWFNESVRLTHVDSRRSRCSGRKKFPRWAGRAMKQSARFDWKWLLMIDLRRLSSISG